MSNPVLSTGSPRSSGAASDHVGQISSNHGDQIEISKAGAGHGTVTNGISSSSTENNINSIESSSELIKKQHSFSSSTAVSITDYNINIGSLNDTVVGENHSKELTVTGQTGTSSGDRGDVSSENHVNNINRSSSSEEVLEVTTSREGGPGPGPPPPTRVSNRTEVVAALLGALDRVGSSPNGNRERIGSANDSLSLSNRGGPINERDVYELVEKIAEQRGQEIALEKERQRIDRQLLERDLKGTTVSRSAFGENNHRGNNGNSGPHGGRGMVQHYDRHVPHPHHDRYGQVPGSGSGPPRERGPGGGNINSSGRDHNINSHDNMPPPRYLTNRERMDLAQHHHHRGGHGGPSGPQNLYRGSSLLEAQNMLLEFNKS